MDAAVIKIGSGRLSPRAHAKTRGNPTFDPPAVYSPQWRPWHFFPYPPHDIVVLVPLVIAEMAEIHGPGGPPPHIPDDLTVAQFMLDVDHESRPVRPEAQANPWMIEDATGRAIRFAEVCALT